MNPKVVIEDTVQGDTVVTVTFTKDYMVDRMAEEMPRIILEKVTNAYLEKHQDEIIALIDMDKLGTQINGKVLGAALKQLANK